MKRTVGDLATAVFGKRSDAASDRRLLWLAIAIWTGFVILEALIDPAITGMALIWATHGFILMMLLKVCLDRAPRQGGWRLAVFVLCTVVIAVLQTALDVFGTQVVGPALLTGLAPPPEGIRISPLGVAPILTFKVSLRSYLWIYGLYAAALALHGVARRELEAREESYAARLAAQRAELDALRLRVNPHFLFNALNGLASMAGSDKSRETEEMALALARYYRSSFIDIDRDLIPLGVELDAVQDYLELEGHRLEKLEFVLECSDTILEAELPPMILQPLIENAVKYGVAGHAEPPPVRVTARREGEVLQLICESGVSPNPDGAGAGTGLQTVRRRLEKAFGDRATLVLDRGDTRWRATIEMPVLGLD